MEVDGQLAAGGIFGWLVRVVTFVPQSATVVVVQENLLV